MKNRPQAKNISDSSALKAVIECGGTGRYNWAMAWDVSAKFPDLPAKVVRAKMAALIRRGLLDGCTCGCRGDFWVTDLGVKLISTEEDKGEEK